MRNSVRLRAQGFHRFLRVWFASSTNEGKQSPALTSTHSPLEGSCKAIQFGYSLQMTTKPRLPASSSLRLLRDATSSRLLSAEPSVDALLARSKNPLTQVSFSWEAVRNKRKKRIKFRSGATSFVFFV